MSESDNTDKPNPSINADTEGRLESGTSRREALKQLGRYAAYTPPVMMMLLVPRKGSAQMGSSPLGTPPNPP